MVSAALLRRALPRWGVAASGVAAVGGPPCMFALTRELLVPSFLRRQESMRSVGVKGTPNVRRRPITRGALGALVGRRADGGSSHGWVVAWIPACAGMTEGGRNGGRVGVAEGWAWRKSVGWLGCGRGGRAVRVELSERGLSGVGAASLRHSSAPSVTPACPSHPPVRHTRLSVIPAEAGIHAVCGGQGHSQCSTAPDHPRRVGGSGGPSGGWRLVARLGGRMDSCLRRNDGGDAGMAEGLEWRKDGNGGSRWGGWAAVGG